MNIERLKQLREHLAGLPEERFHYSDFFGNDVYDPNVTWSDARKDCGTTACVAGWACVLFGPANQSTLDSGDPEYQASAILDIESDDESEFLFFRECSRANRSDAIRRLDWLIAGNSIAYYPWREESYNVL